MRVTAQFHPPDLVTFSVVDTGIGIAKENQKELFNDFVQVDSPIQKRLRGTGLGLSLSKKLAELLGGTVGIVSDLGLWFDIFSDSASSSARVILDEQSQFADYRIHWQGVSQWRIAASQRYWWSMTIRPHFIRRGVFFELQVSMFAKPQPVRKLWIWPGRPHAIVLDVNLPDIDGFEVCRISEKQREDSAHSDHPSLGNFCRNSLQGSGTRFGSRRLFNTSGRAAGSYCHAECLSSRPHRRR